MWCVYYNCTYQWSLLSLLEMILDTSKHFAESATDEYNATVGNRRFEHAGHAIHGSHRDLDAMVLYYDQQWSAAFNSKLPGFEPKQPTKRPRATGQVGRESPSRPGGERAHVDVHVANDYEPPGGSPLTGPQHPRNRQHRPGDRPAP